MKDGKLSNTQKAALQFERNRRAGQKFSDDVVAGINNRAKNAAKGLSKEVDRMRKSFNK